MLHIIVNEDECGKLVLNIAFNVVVFTSSSDKQSVRTVTIIDNVALIYWVLHSEFPRFMTYSLMLKGYQKKSID